MSAHVTNGFRTGQLKALLLGSASALVLIAAGGGIARAAQDLVTLVTPGSTGFFGATATGFVTGGTSQVQTADVAGLISSAQADLVANTVTTGSNTGTSNTVSVNTFGATATGNTQSNTVDLAAIGSGTASDGIGILATQINASPAAGTGGVSSTPPALTSSVTGSSMSAKLYDFQAGTASVANNTISATTTGSSNTTSVSGQVPNGYTSSTAGSNSFTGNTPSPSTLSGTVAVSTVQENLNVGQGFGSDASVATNAVSLLVTPTAGAVGNESVDSGSVQSNALAANFVGNASQNGITVQSGTNPTFTGSLALSNVSANNVDGTVATTTSGVAASNTGSSVTATIQDFKGSSDTLTGALTVSGNSISSSAAGNQSIASGSTGGAGNQITLADGENFSGVGSQANSINSLANLDATTSGGLVLFNSQSNAGTGPAGAGLTAETQGGAVTASVANVDGGSVSLASNGIKANATGNNTTNAILAPGATLGTTDSISGSAALGSVQVNEYAPVTANLGTTTGNTISATVGTQAGTVSTATVAGTVSLAGNSLAASASGNQVGNTLDLAATAVTGSAGSTQLTLQRTDPTGETTTAASSGASINSVQRLSDASTVSATNQNSTVSLDASGVTSTIANSALSITGGATPTVSASAVGNGAANSLNLAATTLSNETGGVVNAQTVGENAPNTITAALTNPSLIITAGNASSSAGLSDTSAAITGNLLQAFAAGNQGTNGLSASGTTVAVPTQSGPASTINYSLTAAGGLYFDSAPATLQGAYDVLSSQAVNSPVSAQFTGTTSPVSILVGGSGTGAGALDGSQVNADRNTLYATAIGNEIAPGGGNQLTLSAGTLDTTASGYSPLAGITSIQEMGSQGSATANIDTVTGGGPLYQVQIGGNVGTTSGALVSISNNLAEALAAGNYGSNNTLNVTGTNITDPATTPLTGLQITGVGLPPSGTGSVTADLPLTVSNVQSVAPGTSIAATVQDTTGSSVNGYGALISVGGTTANQSTLTEANNVFLASATDNNALSNSVNVSGVDTLSVGAGVQNLQYSAADASATLGKAGTPPTAPTLVDNLGTLPFNVSGTGSATISGGTLTITGAPLVISTNGLTFTQVSDLQTLLGGGTYNSSAHTLTLVANTYTVPYPAQIPTVTPGTVYVSSGTDTGNLSLSLPGTPGSSGTPNTVAQIISVNDPITGSTLLITSAAGTTPSGATAVSNNAVNTLSLSANTITGASLITTPGASVNGTTNALSALADYAVQNGQAVVGAGPTATASETLGIANFSTGAPSPYGVTGSTLAITGNGLQAVSEGNVANNTLSLSMTDSGTTAPSGALLSAQYANVSAEQTAISSLDAYVPAAVGGTTPGTGSSSTVSGNTNTALSVANDVTNTASATGTNVAGLTGVGLSSYTGGAGTIISATGDYTLNNTQDATGRGVAATATTNVANYDGVLAETSGISQSSVSFSNNATSAESDANRANVGGGNSLTLTATNLSASGALTNSQDSTMVSDAIASSTINLSLVGGAGTPAGVAATGASVSLGGNSTSATARGNIAINSLVADGTATNGSSATTTQANGLVSFGPLTASAGSAGGTNQAVANVQTNSGAVSASSTGATEAILSSSATASASALNSSISLNGNSVTAEGDGNVSSSSLTLSGANVINSGALTSAQVNSAGVELFCEQHCHGICVRWRDEHYRGNLRFGAERYGEPDRGHRPWQFCDQRAECDAHCQLRNAADCGDPIDPECWGIRPGKLRFAERPAELRPRDGDGCVELQHRSEFGDRKSGVRHRFLGDDLG